MALARPSVRDCSYNLFRNKPRPELLCAVPEDHPVPSLLGPEEWVFVRALRPSDPLPPGFNDRAAYTGVRFNGLYLFQVTVSHERMAA
nr:hypothetical protein [Microvirga ossetica]